MNETLDFSICAKDAPDMASAKNAFTNAKGQARNDARVIVLCKRLDALESHAAMLAARLYLAQADIAETTAALRYYAPERTN